MKKPLSLLLGLLFMVMTLTSCATIVSKPIKHSSEANHVPSENTSAITGSLEDHDHAAPTIAISGDKVKYQLYTNADKTYRLVFRDHNGKAVAEFDKIAKAPANEIIDADKGIYELGWATGNGPSDFYCIYYNVNTGAVSKLFHAPRGTDGVRIAYGSEDQTKIIVQDVFASGSFYKEYPLEDAYTDATDIIVGGNLKADKKTVLISYVVDEKGSTQHATVHLYE